MLNFVKFYLTYTRYLHFNRELRNIIRGVKFVLNKKVRKTSRVLLVCPSFYFDTLLQGKQIRIMYVKKSIR